jgi:hypothetical protein
MDPQVRGINPAQDDRFVKAINVALGGPVVSVPALVPRFTCSNPAEGVKNPQHAFLRRGSKAVDPIS